MTISESLDGSTHLRLEMGPDSIFGTEVDRARHLKGQIKLVSCSQYKSESHTIKMIFDGKKGHHRFDC